MYNELLSLAITFILALAWLRVNDFFAHRGWVSSAISRKIIHIGTGPIFVLCWLLFKENSSRLLAALVPLLITIQFFLVGSGIIRDQVAVQAMSRSGDRREILRGPLFYEIIFVAMTIIYWKDSPIGIIALMIMCGGDGLADIIGREIGKKKLSWNSQKSWSGSIAMFAGGYSLTFFILGIYIALGVFSISIKDIAFPLLLICLVATWVESLPLPEVDNITTTLSAILLGHLLL